MYYFYDNHKIIIQLEITENKTDFVYWTTSTKNVSIELL
jgi:hypothetical protein